MYPAFITHIKAMNRTYKLPNISDEDILRRLAQFKDILGKEFAELSDIQKDFGDVLGDYTTADCLRARTGMADLCGDIIVYCASEMVRWGIPPDQVLAIIMSSNFSKLGADGEPIINPDNGKFEKGPNYWKPEPLICAVLAGNFNLDVEAFSSEVPSATMLLTGQQTVLHHQHQSQGKASQQPQQEPETQNHQLGSGSPAAA